MILGSYIARACRGDTLKGNCDRYDILSRKMTVPANYGTEYSKAGFPLTRFWAARPG